MPAHGRQAIRNKIKDDYKKLDNFKAVGSLWGLSDGTVHRFINIRNFWPRSKKVNDAIKKHGRSIGIIVGQRPLPKQ